MTVEERMERLEGQLQFVATLQRTNEEDIARLIEQNSQLSGHLKALAQNANVLNERTIQAMEAINRLARIADIHEQRIEDLEDQRPS